MIDDMTALDGWGNFYMIVDSSAGALIGLQFVVMTLVAENPLARSSSLGKTFGTPTIIHFSVCCCFRRLSALHGTGSPP